ncbi:DUF7350 domain-containing protein [Halopiger djelfimassiliensis]|uniref:DUF7350 domain-containing protein n=1 Tax=Halopiger djelfimassiliensis TaxID=1293047 RepID=UPI0006775EAB|nr:hypothetical protein [Halopiger djelfimassiliensis]
MPDRINTPIDRRTFVRRAGVISGTVAVAGCSTDDGDSDDPGDEDDGTETTDDGGEDSFGPPIRTVEDPPDAVYLPTHRESMRTLEPVEAGEYLLAPMLSYPHPFWIVTGAGEREGTVERVEVDSGHGVHLMVTVWDAETGIVLPVDEGARITIERDGDQVGPPHSPWTMISQQMGFHFGDNVPLDGDGTYTATVELPPLSVRKTGALEGRLTERATASFEFVYDDDFREAVIDGVEYFDQDRWGRPGALEPMGHGEDGDHGSGSIPYSALPELEDYPGTLLVDPDADARPDDTTALPRSGDAAILAVLFDAGTRLADGDERYLLVSPRTPYNRVPLADMSLHASVERDGEVVSELPLEQTIDGEYDHHYGESIPDVRPGDSVTITIESPPQVARHQGYDTAFLEMPPVELTVPAAANGGD